MAVEYPYTKSPVDPSSLLAEINASAVGVVPDEVRFLKPNALTIVMPEELDAAAETALDAVVAAHAGHRPIEKFYLRTDDTRSGLTLQQAWYEVDNGDGTFAKLARTIDYTYAGRSLMQEVHKSYSSGGTVVSQQTYQWFTLPGGKTSKKRV